MLHFQIFEDFPTVFFVVVVVSNLILVYLKNILSITSVLLSLGLISRCSSCHILKNISCALGKERNYIFAVCGILFFFFFFTFYFIFKLYILVLVLPNIKMNPPQVYMCSPSWTLLPPPSPYHSSGSSQCTSPKHPVSCIEPGLATPFVHDMCAVFYRWAG